jgi:hypothetical protein
MKLLNFEIGGFSHFDLLGTLHQKVPDKLPRLETSRWEERPELEKFMHD